MTETMLQETFVEALNRLIVDREAVIEDIRLLLPKLESAALEKENAAAVQERDDLHRQMQSCIEENATTVLDQQKYNIRFEELMSRYEAAKVKVSNTEEKLRHRMIRRETLRQFIAELGGRPDLIKQFDETAWITLADRVTITADRKAVFHFKSGAEISVDLR